MTARSLLMLALAVGAVLSCCGQPVRLEDSDRSSKDEGQMTLGGQWRLAGRPQREQSGASRNRIRPLSKSSQVQIPGRQSERKIKVIYDKPNAKRSFQKSPKRKKSQARAPESDIYFVRLPPAPYTYIEGLGYVSRPPSFSSASLALPQHRPRPQSQQSPLVRPALEFVSNGKPTSVYRWTAAKPDSAIIKLDLGPYVFNGKPQRSVLVIDKERSPKGANALLK